MKAIKYGLFVVFVVIMFAISGCTEKVTLEEANKMVMESQIAQQKLSDDAIDAVKNEFSAKIDSLNDEIEKINTQNIEMTTEIDAVKLENEILKQENDQLNGIKETETAYKEKVSRIEKIELSIGEKFGNKEYDDSDIKYLIDDEIKFDGKYYDVYEVVSTTSDLTVMYSLVNDEEFSDELYVGMTDKGALEYKYVFDDELDMSDISREEPLKISFLGKNVVITGMDSDSFEIRTGETFWLDKDSKETFFDSIVELYAVSTDGDSAGFVIDGQIYWLDEGDEQEIGKITLSVEEVIAYHSNNGLGSAKVIVANTEDIYQTFEDGDSLNYDEKSKDAEWVYTLSTTGDNINYIGVKYNQKIDELDDDFKPIKLGERFVFPNNYVSLSFDSLNVDEYNTISIEFDDVENENGDEFDGIIFKEDSGEGFLINDEQTDTVYAWTENNGNDWNLAYVDEENDVIDVLNDNFEIVFEDITYSVFYDGDYVNCGLVSFKLGLEDGNFKFLGDSESDAENDELLYNLIPIGNRDYDVVGFDGIVIKEPKNNGENDYIEFIIPEDEVEITFLLG